MILSATLIAEQMDVPYGDIRIGLICSPRRGPCGRAEYDRLEAAICMQDWYRQRIAENERSYEHVRSEIYTERINKYRARLIKAQVCEEAWRREDGEEEEG